MTKQRINELSLIAALLTIGLEPTNIEQDNKVVYYIFEHKELDKFIDSYWQGKMELPALPFSNQIKAVKICVYGLTKK